MLHNDNLDPFFFLITTFYTIKDISHVLVPTITDLISMSFEHVSGSIKDGFLPSIIKPSKKCLELKLYSFSQQSSKIRGINEHNFEFLHYILISSGDPCVGPDRLVL